MNQEHVLIDAQGYFEGYASVFDVVDMDGDCILKGAYAKSLKRWGSIGKKPKLLWNHCANLPIGFLSGIEEDSYGLRVKGCLLLDIPQAVTAYTLIKSKAIDGFSIGFYPKKTYLQPQRKVRYIAEAEVFEVSFVTFASNQKACVSVVKNKNEPSFPLLEARRKNFTLLRRKVRN